MNNTQAFSISEASQGISDELKSYLEAQYHIRDDSLVEERRRLFDEGTTICQEPFLEATPSYATAEPFENLNIPTAAKDLLVKFARADVGVFNPPYIHQADALEAFLTKKRHILASTGTGSGKTEIFLYSILGALAEQNVANATAAQERGCRAIILYPMNALVADQLVEASTWL